MCLEAESPLAAAGGLAGGGERGEQRNSASIENFITRGMNFK